MNKEYIYFKENLLQSILSDIATFGFLCGSVWFNYQFVGGSHFLNAIILIMLLLFITAKASGRKRTFISKEELIKYLNK